MTDEERRIVAYLAECVGAQTLDVKAISKGRRESLLRIVNWMLELADGHTPVIVSPGIRRATTDQVRERFPEVTE